MKFLHFAPRPKKRRLFYILALAGMMMVPRLAKAQMFSVNNVHLRRNNIPHYHVYAGAGPVRFDYRPNNGEGIYAFSGQAFQLALEAYNFKLFLGTGLGLGRKSFFEIALQGGYKLPVYRSPKVHIGVPLLLKIGITSVANDEPVTSFSTRQFREGSLVVRTGVDFTARLTRLMRFSAGIIPDFGLVYSANRTSGGGSVLGVLGKARLYFDHLFGSAGLSLGYGYRFRRFSIKGTTLDYNAFENKFLIGVTF
jgi:hypothetical protein